MSADTGPQTRGHPYTSAERTPPEHAGTALENFFQPHEQTRQLYPRAVLVGALAGILAVTFQWSLVGGEALRLRMIL
jgi:hypothetical protein